MSFTMYTPAKILFGAGRLNDLHAQKMPGKKGLIVISNGTSENRMAISQGRKSS